MKPNFYLGYDIDEESCGEEERLNVLHSRIQQEADKIRKWKNTMELDMQQKERRLKESQMMVDRQRKELTEAQVNLMLMMWLCMYYYFVRAAVPVHSNGSIVIFRVFFKANFN